MNVTGEQVKQAMIAANITYVPLRECSICCATIGYSRAGENLFFEPACDCSYAPPEQRSWSEVADTINLQNQEWQIKIAAKFGLQLANEASE